MPSHPLWISRRENDKNKGVARRDHVKLNAAKIRNDSREFARYWFSLNETRILIYGRWSVTSKSAATNREISAGERRYVYFVAPLFWIHFFPRQRLRAKCLKDIQRGFSACVDVVRDVQWMRVYRTSRAAFLRFRNGELLLREERPAKSGKKATRNTYFENRRSLW